jgi:hypothetical protein
MQDVFDGRLNSGHKWSRETVDTTELGVLPVDNGVTMMELQFFDRDSLLYTPKTRKPRPNKDKIRQGLDGNARYRGHGENEHDCAPLIG